jgi:hypothetical protein
MFCVLSTLLGHGTAAQPAHAAPSGLSTEQFKGVAGVRQIGPEFPVFEHRMRTGSQAIYFVETDALSAMNAFIERARQIGFLKAQDFSSGFCATAPYGDTRVAGPGEARVGCGGRYARADGTGMTIDVWVCESCPETNSTASVAITKKSGLTGVEPIPALEPISTTYALSPAARESVLTPTDATLVQAGFPVVKGTQLAVPVFADSSLCAITWIAPLRIQRDPTHAFDVYATNMFDSPSKRATTIKISGGREVTQQADPDGLRRLTLVQGGTLRQPWILASECERTLD